MGLSPAELALTYSTASGGFKPPPQPPRKHPASHSLGGKRRGEVDFTEEFSQAIGVSAESDGTSPSASDAQQLIVTLKGLFRESREFREQATLQRQARRLGRLLLRARRSTRMGKGKSTAYSKKVKGQMGYRQHNGSV